MKVTRGFRFDVGRAIQAAGVVLRDRGPMDRMRLLKILYIASRRALEETGKPIIGGHAAALENGPLHSEVYDQIKGSANDLQWRRYFRNLGHTVKMEHDPGRLDLSPYEIDVLNQTAEWAEQFETFELSRWTHENLPEYIKNEPAPRSSKAIPVDDLLQAVGFSPQEIEEAIAEHQAHDEIVISLEGPR